MSCTSSPATFTQGFHAKDSCNSMPYLTLGKTGLEISKFSFGAAVFSSIYGEFDAKEAEETLVQALKSGVNYIDTAPWYGQGQSEGFLGQVLRNVPRSAYYIATKVGRYCTDYKNMFDFSAKRSRESVERSLELLGLQYVDVIQIHDIEFANNVGVVINECLPELENLIKEGKARFIGVTGYSLHHLKECILHAPGKFDVVLPYARFTLMDNSLESYIKFFQNENLGIVCASGHAMGLLTNCGPQAWHPASDEQKQLCRKAAKICKEAGIELGKLAMYHFLQLSGATTFLTGMKTRHALDMNLNVFYCGLNLKEQEVLQLLKDTIFTKSLNWEGVELERYRSAMGNLQN
uniref:NADP-dependent oxidoreductase domain-containing protein n=1 Tax=Glossina palpalis gambiensis TaxID=67801 RepID=A0A1B0BW93_9MUSC